jgi:hypothetical protein
MENNDSPYIYEKPLRSSRTKRSQRLAGLSALGLVGMVGVFGGTALANSFVAEKPNETSLPLAGSSFDSPTEAAVAVVNVAAVENDTNSVTNPSLISVPVQLAKPANNSVKVNLPSVPSQSFGNTSSATPASGSYLGGSSSPASYEDSDDHEERGERDHEDGSEKHDREDDD